MSDSSSDPAHEGAPWRDVLSAITGHLQDTVVITDRLGIIVDVYGSYESVGGWHRDQVVGQSVVRFIHPLDVAIALGRLMLNAVDPSLSGRHRLEVRALQSDGQYRTTEVMVSNQLANPAILGLVLTIRDIAPRREAELDRAASEERFRAVTDLSGDIVALVSAAGTIDYSSEACERVLGYPANSRLGQPVFDNIVAEDRPRAIEAFQRLAAAPLGSRELIEVRMTRLDGEVRWMQAAAVNLLAHAAVGAIVFNARDVTEQRQAELALTTARARLDAALWGARVGLYALDLEHDRAEMSPQFFEMTGISAAEWAADRHPWDGRLHPRDRRHVLERFRAHIAGELPAFEAEYRLRTPRGWAWILDRARITERDPDGRPRTLCGTVMDVSARKELERELIETTTREQQRLSQDIHDGLGQELTGIALLLRSSTKRIGGAGGRAGSDLEAAIGHLNNAIRNARALAHGLHPVRAEDGGLAGALKALAANARLASVEVSVDVADWTERPLSTDVADHVYRVVQEALGNALRHARATRITIRLATRPDGLEAAVRDNGIGVPAAKQHVPGLGRRIMAHRAQLIGGSVEWTRPPAGGTEVLLHVPWAAAIAVASA